VCVPHLVLVLVLQLLLLLLEVGLITSSLSLCSTVPRGGLGRAVVEGGRRGASRQGR